MAFFIERLTKDVSIFDWPLVDMDNSWILFLAAWPFAWAWALNYFTSWIFVCENVDVVEVVILGKVFIYDHYKASQGEMFIKV
jgi:hypothetical protein